MEPVSTMELTMILITVLTMELTTVDIVMNLNLYRANITYALIMGTICVSQQNKRRVQ